MRIDIDLPWGHLHIEREPMEDGKFYALIGLAAGVLFVILIVSCARI